MDNYEPTNDQAPINPPSVSPEVEPVQPENSPKEDNKKPLKILLAVIIIVLLVGVILFIFIKNGILFNSKDKGEGYLSENEVTEGEMISTEDYIAKQEAIIESTSDPKEKLNAELDLVSFYTALGEYENAQNLLNSLDTSTFDNECFFWYYNVSARLAEAQGDINKRDEFNAKAADYKNLMQAEQS